MRKLTYFLCFVLCSNFAFSNKTTQQFSFRENKGQWNRDILFESEIPSGKIYFHKERLMYKLTDFTQLNEWYHHPTDNTLINEHAVEVKFLNGKPKNIKPTKQKSYYSNYFISNTPENWTSNVHDYEQLNFYEMYKNIDLIFYGKENGLKYDFVVLPGGNPNDIKVKFTGANDLVVNEAGELIISTSIYDIIEEKPYVYQIIKGEKIEISASFKIVKDVLTFDLAYYDKSTELYIDPNLVFSTYSNTSNSGAIVSADAATYDLNDNLLVAAGSLQTGYPPTVGAYQTNPTTNNGGFSTTVAKINPNNGNLIFATYLAGNNNNVSYPLSLTVDDDDNVYVLGHTNQDDFPTVGGYQNNFAGGYDYYISKLNGIGTNLLASTFLGGQGDEVGLENNFPSGFPSGILFHNNEVYIAGTSSSSDFPTTAGVIQTTKGFGFDNDAILSKLNANLSNLIWSTYFGSTNGDDVLSDVKVMSNNSVVACGYTSGGLAGMTGLNTNSAGNKEGFVIKIDNGATTVLSGTYLGTNSDDNARFVHVDNVDDVYIFGASNGNYPTAGGAYADAGKNAYYFVHKLDNNLATTMYATRVGGNVDGDASPSELYPTAFGIDGCQNIYFSGAGEGGNFPTTNDAYTTQVKGVYMCKLDKNAQNLIYGSYFGGSNGSHMHPATNCKYNNQGRLFHTECTTATDYPVINGGISTTTSSNHDAGSFVFDFFFEAILDGLELGEDIVQCNPPVQLNAGIGLQNVTYQWQDGSNDSNYTVTETGLYHVMVYNNCDTIRDTINIEFGSEFAIDLGADTNICPGQSVILDAGVNWQNYTWSDGTNGQSIEVGEGVYWVEVEDAVGCFATDTIEVTEGPITVDIGSDTTLCEGNSFEIIPDVDGSVDEYEWSDGSTGSTLTVSQTGEYWLEVTSPGGCVSSDTVQVNFIAYPDPSITQVGPYCSSDASVNLNAVTGGGTWSGSGITDNSLGTFDPSNAALGDNEVYYEVGNGECLERDTIVIVVNDVFDASITQEGPFCENDSLIQLEAEDAGGIWNGTGIIDSIQGIFDPSQAVVGMNTINYWIEGSCGDTGVVTIEVLPNADASVIQSGPYCETGGLQLLSSVNPGGVWSGVGITDAQTGEFDPSVAQSGTHMVYYTIGGQCGDVDSMEIEVINQLDASITQVGPFCESDSLIQLEAVDAGGVWNGAGIIDSIQGIFDPSQADVGMNTINYRIEGSCGDTGVVTIEVLPNADASVIQSGPYCESDGAVVLQSINAGGVWSGVGITNGNAGVFDPSVAQSGTHMVYYTIGGQCGAIDSMEIAVVNQLDASITQVGSYCEDDGVVQLTAEDAGGVWLGTGIIDSLQGIFDPSQASIGQNTISYEIVGSCGDTGTIEIEIIPRADATIIQSGPYCVTGTAANLSSMYPDGTWSGPGITSATLGTFSPNTAGVGLHMIYYEITGQCGAIDSMEVEVVEEFDPTITDVGPYCEDEGVVYLQSVDAGGIWSATCVNCIDSLSGAFLPSAADTGINMIYYTIKDLCPISDSTEVVINPLPDVSFYSEENRGCAPFTTVFHGYSGSSTATCVWDFGDGSVSGQCDSVEHTFTEDGCYDISLTVTENGCTSSSTLNNYICVYPVPIVDFYFTPEITTIHDPEFQFTDQTIFGGGNWWWDFAGQGNSSEENPSFEFSEPGLYPVCLRVENNGCMDSICHNVLVRGDFIMWIPNTFTPDGDGVNDTFFPKFGGDLPLDYSFKIFNRWGELIYETHEVSGAWDGTYQSSIVQEDVYVYKIRLKKPNDGAYEDYYGNVNVIK